VTEDTGEQTKSLRPLGLLKRGIEECGRHPFVTGLFALLGVAGLFFSIYDFNVAQSQSAESSRAQEEIKREIDAVSEQVEEGPMLAEDRAGFEPIDASYAINPFRNDNVVFDKSYMSDISFVDPQTGEYSDELKFGTISWLLRNDPKAVGDFYFASFPVTSNADRRFVQIAPYIVVQVIDARPFSPDLAFIPSDGRGGSASVRDFGGWIIPQEGMQFIPLLDTDTQEFNSDVDFFRLQPREPEEFVVYLSTFPDYRFELRIGLHYKFDNEHSVHWVTEPFVVGEPSEGSLASWQYSRDGGYFAPPAGLSEDYSETWFQEASDQRAFAESGRVFRPSQIPAEALELR